MKTNMKIFDKIPKIEINEIFPDIFHLEFETQEDLTSTLMRFQEYFESPKFRGKIFTVKEFIEWYATTSNGEFTYFKDWNGFNFPSYVLKPFYDKKFTGLTKKEKHILNIFKNKTGKFYVIGTHKKKKKTLSHEIAHAFFYSHPEYKQRVEDILAKVDLSPIYDALSTFGYHKSVFLDEAHAYLATGYEDLVKEGVNIKKYTNVIKKLEKNYEIEYNRVYNAPTIVFGEYDF